MVWFCFVSLKKNLFKLYNLPIFETLSLGKGWSVTERPVCIL